MVTEFLFFLVKLYTKSFMFFKTELSFLRFFFLEYLPYYTSSKSDILKANTISVFLLELVFPIGGLVS